MFRSLFAKIATAMTALALSVGMGVATAAPASAATAASFCFTWSTGSAYASQPVYLHQANGVQVKPGKTASNGCATFTGLSTTRSYYVQAYTVLGIPATGMQVWSGFTPWTTGTGAGTVHIGTGVVYFRGYV